MLRRSLLAALLLAHPLRRRVSASSTRGVPLTRARFGLVLGALVALLGVAIVAAVLANGRDRARRRPRGARRPRSRGDDHPWLRLRASSPRRSWAPLSRTDVLLKVCSATRSPIPFVTGTSAGPALAAVSALAVAPALRCRPAFGDALAAVWVVWRLARVGGAPVVLVLLAGVVLTAFSGALVMLLLTANDRLALTSAPRSAGCKGGVAVIDQGGWRPRRSRGARPRRRLRARAAARRVRVRRETAATLSIDVGRVTADARATALLAGAAVASPGSSASSASSCRTRSGIVGASHRRLVTRGGARGRATLVTGPRRGRCSLRQAAGGVITGSSRAVLPRAPRAVAADRGMSAPPLCAR